MSAHVPPGWPPGIPPAHTPGWEPPAVAWLLDNCPPDYRLYAGWRKNPVALAWLADRHIDGQIAAMRQAYREARVELGPHVTTEALTEIMTSAARQRVGPSMRTRCGSSSWTLAPTFVSSVR